MYEINWWALLATLLIGMVLGAVTALKLFPRTTANARIQDSVAEVQEEPVPEPEVVAPSTGEAPSTPVRPPPAAEPREPEGLLYPDWMTHTRGAVNVSKLYFTPYGRCVHASETCQGLQPRRHALQERVPCRYCLWDRLN